MSLRTTAHEIFLEALASLDVRTSVTRALSTANTHLRIGATGYDLGRYSEVLMIAIGKAALPMTEGLLEAIQPALTRDHTLKGVVIGSTLPSQPDSRLRYRIGSHPLPDADSAEAATLLLNLLASATDRTLIFFLLSGGASAMVELPLTPAITLAELTGFHQTLVHSGLSIAEMNTLRKHLSAVKGGRLATAAAAATKCTLLVSDVPPSHPEIIGSGPSLPDPTSLANCRHLLATRLSHRFIPPSIAAFFNNPNAPETPKPSHPAFTRANYATLLSSDDLARAAQAPAQARGFTTRIDQTPDEWNFTEAATYLLNRLQDLAEANPGRPVCLINTGEISVPITALQPGLGGRNQHFALHFAFKIAHARQAIAILSAGSDGADGNSPSAGAVVDNTTLLRAGQRGLNPAEALARFDSYPLLQSLGDTLLTGPTGNNLRDLRLLMATADSTPVFP